MEIRLARFLAIALVIAVVGGMLLSGRARKLRRQIAAAPPVTSSESTKLDSARAVTLAQDVYHRDHAARGESPPAPQVAAVTHDSLGYVVVLIPAPGAAGTRAAVRVRVDGGVELRRMAP